MPGFAHQPPDTLRNAQALMAALGVSAAEIDIRPSAQQMLRDLGHPSADGKPVYDITFENVQAGERTSHLFRLANYHGALVLGHRRPQRAGARLGTYGVGDQMSHYNVNASVPKTLIQFLMRWAIATDQFGAEAGRHARRDPRHRDFAGAGPAGDPDADAPEQHSEHDRRPLRAAGLLPLLHAALRLPAEQGRVPGRTTPGAIASAGRWPDLIPPERRNEYSLAKIEHWLRGVPLPLLRTSQFKRSAIPNGPRSAPAARCRRAATGARRATATPAPGWPSCER